MLENRKRKIIEIYDKLDDFKCRKERKIRKKLEWRIEGPKSLFLEFWPLFQILPLAPQHQVGRIAPYFVGLT
jgi:hypothetical protein